MKHNYFLILAVVIVSLSSSALASTIVVDANQSTQSQVNQAAPGDTLMLSPGIHDDIDFHGFAATECNPTVIMSQDPNDPAVIFSNNTGHATLDIESCEWLIIENIVASNGITGIDIKLSEHVILRNSEITEVGNAGLKIRWRSKYVDVINNEIHNTGNNEPQYGEGIYLATAGSRGDEPWNTGRDSLHYIWIEGNEIHDVGYGEAIDQKQNVFYLTIKGNTIYNISLGVENVQTNEGAISLQAGNDSDGNEAPVHTWVEENTIYDVTWGLGNPSNWAVNGCGISTTGGGHYFVNNYIGNCDEAAIEFNPYAVRENLMDDAFFIYVWNNTIDNNWGDDYKSRNGLLSPWIFETDPGVNPYSSQSWCGDQNNCPAPSLGETQSLCGVGNITLDAGMTPDGVSTFEWFKDGVSQGSPSTSANTYQVAQGGAWQVVVDSLGLCSNNSTVSINDQLSLLDLGPDVDLCESTSVTLTAGEFNQNYIYSWSLDGLDLGIYTHTLNADRAGVYISSIEAAGCGSISDEITITSSLPIVLSDTLCEAGSADLSATGQGTIYWYDAIVDGSLLFTGANYQPSITQSESYFVQSGETSTTYTAGRIIMDQLWDGGAYNDRKLKIIVDQTLKIDSVTISAKDAQTAHFRVLGSDNSTVLHDVSSSVSAGVVQIPVGVTLAPGTYFVDAVGSTGTLKYENESSNPPVDHSAYGIQGLISFDAEPTWEAGSNKRWRYFYRWKLSVGSACARVPAHAILDPLHPDCLVSAIDSERKENIELYPNPTSGQVYTELEGPYEIHDAQGLYLESQMDLDVSHLSNGVYLIHFNNGSVQKLIKQ